MRALNPFDQPLKDRNAAENGKGTQTDIELAPGDVLYLVCAKNKNNTLKILVSFIVSMVLHISYSQK